jgi:kumamolisin
MSSQVIVRGSHREHPADSAPAGHPAPDRPIQITIVLRRKSAVMHKEAITDHLSHNVLAEAHGADPTDIAAVEAFAANHGFEVTEVNRATRLVRVSGPLNEMANAFGANLELRQIGSRIFRTRQGALTVPSTLHERVIAVLGFDERPVATTHHRFQFQKKQPSYFTPPELAKIYNFPASAGKNQTIALIELGGGYNAKDLEAYWKQLGLDSVSVTSVSVGNAKNSPQGDPNSADGEVALDIEVAGAIAPAARIIVYFAPNTDQGFLDAINAAIHDEVNKPSVISISWGAAESEWTPQSMNAFNTAFHDAALLGISVCVAAGDNGSSDGERDGHNHVDFPASSPWVLGCGGTRLVANNGIRQLETVWNDGTRGGATGGGVSSYFSKPEYQSTVHVPKSAGTVDSSGRGVPDVAGVADPETGYTVIVDGQEGVVGGTSAVAPLWAALIALCNEQLGKNVGWLHPKLYGTVSEQKGFHDITSGNNGTYKATSGWDCCTGFGAPNGQTILELLKTAESK